MRLPLERCHVIICLKPAKGCCAAVKTAVQHLTK